NWCDVSSVGSECSRAHARYTLHRHLTRTRTPTGAGCSPARQFCYPFTPSYLDYDQTDECAVRRAAVVMSNSARSRARASDYPLFPIPCPLSRMPLPIDASLPELKQALAERTRVVLQAPPGAGKSTRVPLALLHEPWLHARKIVMLEPRRLAARAVASRMAQTLGESAGDTVGYR